MSSRLDSELDHRKTDGLLRQLKVNSIDLIDFYSNDYLGLSSQKEFKAYLRENVHYSEHETLGSSGSRLISGNHKSMEEAESKLSSMYGFESCLIFGSGYQANVGVISALTNRHSTILFDELSHASIRDGIALSHAKSHKFKHNNLADLEDKLKKCEGEVLVVSESVFSMDGDGPQPELLADLCYKYNAGLYIDEAHGAGIFGLDCCGRFSQMNNSSQESISIKMVTFGKAYGLHGAAVFCSKSVREYLVNFCRSFIYTTAPPPALFAEVICAHDYITMNPELRQKLDENCSHAHHLFQTSSKINSPIVAIPASRLSNISEVVKRCELEGYKISGILPPTVKAGEERIRICIHSFNTKDDIDHLYKIIHKS